MRQTADQIEEEAAAWVVRLDLEGRTDGLRAELDAWLAVDVRRQGALLQAEAAWAALGGAQARAAIGAREAASGDNRGRRRFLLGGLAAGLAAAFAGLVVLGQAEHYATGVGEIRRVPLRDGSTAALDTNSEIAVSLSRGRRAVRLVRGEAWFHVAKDASRPFQVEIGQARVQAVGTAFSVRGQGQGAEVIVTEGVVRAWIKGSEGQAALLPAGVVAIVGADGQIAQTRGPAEGSGRLAWMEGKLDFRGETLAQAVVAFNRYNVRQLVIVDPELARQRIHGVFRADDPVAFARALEVTLGARVSYADPKQIRITGPRR